MEEAAVYAGFRAPPREMSGYWRWMAESPAGDWARGMAQIKMWSQINECGSVLY
jgi:hypothetical protein